jgi:hypothetical protein
MESARKREYTEAMKKPPDNPEFARFTAAMQTIMKVPKTELQRRMEEEKSAKQITAVPKSSRLK